MVAARSCEGFGELERSSTTDSHGAVFGVEICRRDEHGRVHSRAETWRHGGSARDRRYAYAYDDRGFLGAAGESTGSGCGFDPGSVLAGATRWEYDAAGNRTDLAVNDEDQATVGDRAYDSLGHLSRRGARTFSYDVFGHLRETSESRSRGRGPPDPFPGRPPRPPPVGARTGATYDFDALGRLVAMHPNGLSTMVDQRFVYRDQINPIAWERQNTTCASRVDALFFVYASMRDTPDLAYVDHCADGFDPARDEDDRVWRYLTDERGSVRVVLDVGSGEIVQEISYDAWGVPSFDAGSESTQPFGYIGGIWDAETDLWHLGARDYDPSIGRWTTKDPIGFEGGYNLYGYAGGDPISGTDATGQLAPLAVIGGLAALGAVTGAVGYLAGALSAGSTPTLGGLASAATTGAVGGALLVVGGPVTAGSVGLFAWSSFSLSFIGVAGEPALNGHIAQATAASRLTEAMWEEFERSVADDARDYWRDQERDRRNRNRDRELRDRGVYGGGRCAGWGDTPWR